MRLTDPLFTARGNPTPTMPVRARRAWSLGLILLAASVQGVDNRAQPFVTAQAGQALPEAVPANARVRFEVLGTQRDRPTGVRRTETHVTLAAGEGARRYLAAGGTDVADICQVGVIGAPASIRAAHVWQLDVFAVAVSSTETTLELRWTRSGGNQDDRQTEAGDTRTLTLGAGDYHIFDYVSAPPGTSSCANVILRVLADPLPPPGPEPLLTVDLWLSQEGAGGRQWTHQRIAGRAGRPLPFRLNALRWSAAGTMLPATTGGPAIGLDVTGTIQATLRPDGFLDASVRVVRGLSWGRARVEGEGEQAFRCAVGEPVAILLPDPKSQAWMRSTGDVTPPFADGVSAQGGTTVVDFARFFAGSHGAVYIVVRRQS
jgi:hypothetical protein